MSQEFFNAIKAGDREKVERFLRATPSLIHEKENSLSPVLVAAYHRQPALADWLAERTVTLTIFEAAATGKTGHIVRLLARDPQLVEAYAEDGFQPLGLACFFGQREAAEYLIKAGAAVNSYSNNALHAAPLQSAVAAGHRECAHLLISHGADPNSREQGGFTPLHAAAQNGDIELIRALIFAGADLDARSLDGRLPADMAIEAKQAEAAQLLMEGITRRSRTIRKSST